MQRNAKKLLAKLSLTISLLLLPAVGVSAADYVIYYNGSYVCLDANGTGLTITTTFNPNTCLWTCYNGTTETTIGTNSDTKCALKNQSTGYYLNINTSTLSLSLSSTIVSYWYLVNSYNTNYLCYKSSDDTRYCINTDGSIFSRTDDIFSGQAFAPEIVTITTNAAVNNSSVSMSSSATSIQNVGSSTSMWCGVSGNYTAPYTTYFFYYNKHNYIGFSTADNPISNYHYLADPTAFSTDSTFYIVTDTDDECPSTGENDYKIRALYAFSSKDMKNWTDHGMVLRYNREVSYISNIWASGAVAHDGVFYIIYPNGASGVGIVSSKDIAGPYIDPVGKLLVGGGGVTNCGGISWCFDPAIFVDDDGKSYMTYGGGSSGSRPYGDNFDLFQFSKLSHDQVTLDVNSRTRISGANKSFEASYIHKRNGTYYFSYNDQSQASSYATSKNIKGPYTYQGVVINNPSSINGKGGNNHHGFAQFKDKWYAVYHDRRLVMDPEHPAAGGQINGLTTGNHRSTSIDEVTWNGDKMNVVKFTESGPTQIADFNPYGVYKALTSSKQRNVRSRTDYTKGQPVLNVLTPLATKESWIRVSGVDFGQGAIGFRVTAASVAEGNKVEIHKGSVTGTLAGTCDLKNTGNGNL